MIGFGSADRRTSRRWRLLIGLQVSLLVFMLVAPLGTIAADPDPTEPPPTEEPSSPPSPEPSAEPTPEPTAAPNPTPDPAPEATPEPTPEPTPDPTSVPTPTPTSPFIVTFAAGVPGAEQAAAVSDAGATTTDTITALRMHAVTASSAAASALAADARVVRVEPDRSRATEADPSDPAYGSQWALPKIGWDQVSGTSVSGSATVAILDTGVDGSQPDLAGQLVAGTSFVGGSATTDPNGHGTAMAGIVAATTDNGVGIAGVGFDGVSIMPVSVLGADGTGRDSDVIEGLVWAADHGADVALMAFSAPSYSSALQAAVDYAWSQGMVLVAATGNDGSSSASFPAGDRGVIGVSNTDSSDALNTSSNYGAATFLAAPGTSIVTLAAGGGTTTVTGTSAAAAHVAAAAALLRASDESLANGVIVGRLARTADAVGTQSETGNGRLNLVRAFADTSSDSVQPEGAAPVGDGGPFVGPYVAAGSGVVSVTVLDSVTNAAIVGATVSCTAGCNGSGNTGTTNASGVAQFTVNYPGNSNTVTLQATAAGYNANSGSVLVANTNNAGNPAVLTILLTPTNDAPVVTAPGTQPTNEGSSTSFALGSFSDAGPSPWTVIVNWGDASPNTTISVLTAGLIPAQSHTYPDGPATHTVTVSVRDTNGTGLTGQATFQITVNNVAPTVTFTSGDTTVNESGVTLHTYTFTVSDPGDDTVIGNGTTCGVGGTQVGPTTPGFLPPPSHPMGTTFSFDCRFDDGPKDPDVQANATDSDNATGAFTTFDVHVNNVDPTADIANTGPINEGGSATVSLTSPFDPSSADTTAGFHYAFACDGASLAGATYAGSGTTSSTSCDFDTPGTHIVRARIIDKDGGFNEYTTDVEVTDVAPTITITKTAAPPSINEPSANVLFTIVITNTSGDTDPVTILTLSDSAFGPLDGQGDCDISPIPVVLVAGASYECSFTGLVTGDGPTSHSNTVTATAKDDDLGGPDAIAQATTTVTVNNVAPTATLANSGPVNEGSPATISFSNPFDPSPADTTAGFHYAFDCDGGSLAGATYAGSSTSPTTTCTFPDGPANEVVSGAIIDKDGGLTQYTTTVQVNNVAPTVTFTSGDTTVNESGVTLHTYTFTVSDPGDDTVIGNGTTCGVGGTQVGPTTPGFLPPPSHPMGTTFSFDCRFDDGPKDPDVQANATDSDNATGAFTTFDVHVNNVDPTADIANTGPINEGGSATVSLTSPFDPSSADTTAGFHYAFACDGASLAGATYAGSGTTSSISCTFNDNGSFPVKARIIDKDNGFTEYTTTVTVNNVAPTATLANSGPVNEGSPATISFSNPFDPSPADTTAGFHYAFDCDGGSLAGATYAGSSTSPTTTCTFPDGPANEVVSGAIIDKDGGLTQYTTTVQVNNVAPTVTFTSGDTTVNESGVTLHTYTFTVSDPGDDTVIGNGTTCGVGGTQVGPTTPGFLPPPSHPMGTTFSFDCRFDDGPKDPDVQANATDSDNATGAFTTFDVHVNNVDPTADIANTGPINEGGSATVSLTSPFDPSSADTTAGFHYAFACDGASLAGATYAGSGTTSSISCTFNDNGSFPVKARIIDKDNGFTEYTTTVTVNNVAPTATLANSGPVNEGSPATISLTSPFDPSSADTTAGFHYAFACTGGTAALATTYATALNTTGSTTCTFADNGTYTVWGRIFDKDNGASTYSTVVTVNNLAPTLDTPLFAFNPFTGVATASISFSDPGWPDTHTAVIYWGDGTLIAGTLGGNENLQPDATGSFAASHIYPIGCAALAPKVVVTDDDGGSTTHTYAGGIDHYTTAFQAPIQDGVRNIVKLGNVIPVKLQITNCGGQAVLGKTLSIGYIGGDVYDDDDAGLVQIVESVSSADTNGVMRQVDSKYMYNLATKSLPAGLPYTVVIREPSTNQFVASFVIQAKK